MGRGQFPLTWPINSLTRNLSIIDDENLTHTNFLDHNEVRACLTFSKNNDTAYRDATMLCCLKRFKTFNLYLEHKTYNDETFTVLHQPNSPASVPISCYLISQSYQNYPNVPILISSFSFSDRLLRQLDANQHALH